MISGLIHGTHQWIIALYGKIERSIFITNPLGVFNPDGRIRHLNREASHNVPADRSRYDPEHVP